MIVDIIHYKTDDGTIFNAKEDAIYHEKTLLLKELLLEITKSGSRCQCVDKIIDYQDKIFKLILGSELNNKSSALHQIKNCESCLHHKRKIDCQICENTIQDKSRQVCICCENFSNWRNEKLEAFLSD